jgi:hypothetical protein
MTPEQLKKIQKLAKLSNKAVAERLKVSVSLVEKLRTGKRKITRHMAWLITEFLTEKNRKEI